MKPCGHCDGNLIPWGVTISHTEPICEPFEAQILELRKTIVNQAITAVRRYSQFGDEISAALEVWDGRFAE